ncbi:MAG: sensor histidine kinase [Streptosporangiaceae bacterium]
MTAVRSGLQRMIRSRWDRTPLRVRLVAAVLVLVAVALVATETAGTLLLRAYLVARTDDQLVAVSRSLDEGFRPAPQLLPSAYFAEIFAPNGDRVARVWNPLGRGRTPPAVPATRARAALHTDRPFTVSARGHPRRHWRVLVTSLDDGDILVVAVGLGGVDSIVRRLVAIDVAVGVIVLAGLAGTGYVLVRASLRPLAEIEKTAAAIAGGELHRRIPPRDPRTEVGRLGWALNGMLSQVEAAFRARAVSETSARRSEERMRRFVADASHELRTPLTSIRGFAEFHRRATDRGPATQLVRRIEDQATRMSVLVDDLLLLARLDQQRPLRSEPIELISLAADVVLDTQDTTPDHPVDLVRGRQGTDASVTVRGDEPRLRQALGNLVSNAVTHTPPGTPVRVTVGATRRDGRDLALCEVADRGPGLSAEAAEHVFERFYRADPARGRPGGGGAGLGLSIVAAIVDAHTGSIEVDTSPGRGVIFRIVLPFASREVPGQSPEAPV